MRRWTLVLLALLPACEAAQGVDERLRRIDLLDRVFEPARFRPEPPPAPAPAPVVEAVAAPEPVAVPDAVAAPDTVAMPLPESSPAPWFPEPEPEPAPPPADPAVRTQALLRQQPWLSRFWSELTGPQQARVARRLPRDSAARWDGMGLTDRVALLYGTGR
jgi:hypothetical protein